MPRPTVPLTRSEALRAGSRAEHESAESSTFVADLLAGRASAAQYVAYLRRLRIVYAALEAAVHDHRDHPALAGAHDPALHRGEALDADLVHWSGGASPDVRSPAADAYRERLAQVRSTPHLLLAHHYTRYLGDLSGGQVLARAVRRGFPDRRLERGGLDFYAFDALDRPVPWKRAYRAHLDALALTPQEDLALVAEVRRAFGLNHDLLDEVAALAG